MKERADMFRVLNRWLASRNKDMKMKLFSFDVKLFLITHKHEKKINSDCKIE